MLRAMSIGMFEEHKDCIPFPFPLVVVKLAFSLRSPDDQMFRQQ